MLTPQFVLNLATKLVLALLPFLRGSCTGIEQALGGHVNIAVKPA